MAKALMISVLMSLTHSDVLHILSECHHCTVSVSHDIASLIFLLSQHPVKTYGYAFFFSLTGYFGISFVLALIKLFGALVAVTGEFSRLLHNGITYFWNENTKHATFAAIKSAK